MPVSPYMSKPQAAKYLGVSVLYIEEQIKKGKLRAFKPSYRILRVHVKDLDGLMFNHSTIGAPA